MSNPERFPDALQSSAVPRWSHRDPVECVNPFAPDDERHPKWHAAPCHAKDTLARTDAELEPEQARNSRPYPARLVTLAIARFDVWSQRGLAIVASRSALEDFERWLDDYRENWLKYVDDTCPHVDVVDDLRSKLEARARFWIDEAHRTFQSS